MTTVELFTSKVCPFAQRVRMVLLVKGIDHTLTEIDLQNKPIWFTEFLLMERYPS